MRITRDDNPAEIERYAHIKPAPISGPLRCFARCPGTRYTCMLSKGHSGPHVAHTFFKKVSAVWDEDSEQWSLSAAYQQAHLTLTPEKERGLFQETVTPEQEQMVDEAFEVLLRYFFNKASHGESFGSLHRIKERFGRSLEENYGLTTGPFMDLATAYWTFKLEVRDFVDEHPNTGLSEVLERIELDVASVFFPTPGPATVPLEERRETQREILSTLAPEMDIERFLAENPILRTQSGSGRGMRIVPVTFGVACWLIAAGLYYFVPHVITAIIGIFLLWFGWSSIKVAFFGSQKLIDAMTMDSEADKDEEVAEEWRKTQKFK